MTSLKRISFKSLALSLFIIILINSAFSASAASINVNPVGIEPYEERFELDYKNETAKTAVVLLIKNM
ncbi:MAG TPA: hypothetical protein DEO32_04010 [Ruminococcaceae bacterium]|nr:hypothetical protein [Oscillospiraceae bacterium]